jgi:glycosyltransferase involved in cell wall biosynthesis
MLPGKRKIRTGIIANEFFDPTLGRLGGFGWAAGRASDVLNNRSDGRFEAIFLSGELNRANCSMSSSENTKLVLNSGKWYRDIVPLYREKIDVLLTIDYRPSYNAVISALPGVPVVVWVRDPRTPDDHTKILSLRIPGRENETPPGIFKVNTMLLSRYASGNPLLRRKVYLANKMPYMTTKNESVYGLPPSNLILPNPDIIDYQTQEENPGKSPRVVFIGRLDPIKRPWLFIELARHFPDIEFIMMGNNHFSGKRGWVPENVPINLKMTGHITGDEKLRLLASARVLVNTSIHEESPVSVFEALACNTPVLSYEDWGDIVKNYGISIGNEPGTGLEGIPRLIDGLSYLLKNPEIATGLGKAGRTYVQQAHNDTAFLNAFSKVCREAELKTIHSNGSNFAKKWQKIEFRGSA